MEFHLGGMLANRPANAMHKPTESVAGWREGTRHRCGREGEDDHRRGKEGEIRRERGANVPNISTSQFAGGQNRGQQGPCDWTIPTSKPITCRGDEVPFGR